MSRESTHGKRAVLRGRNIMIKSVANFRDFEIARAKTGNCDTTEWGFPSSRFVTLLFNAHDTAGAATWRCKFHNVFGCFLFGPRKKKPGNWQEGYFYELGMLEPQRLKFGFFWERLSMWECGHVLYWCNVSRICCGRISCLMIKIGHRNTCRFGSFANNSCTARNSR